MNIRKRTNDGQRTTEMLHFILCSRNMRYKIKTLMYTATVESVVLYRAEMNIKEQKSLLSIEMAYLKRSRIKRFRINMIRYKMEVGNTIVEIIEQKILMWWYGRIR